MKKITKIDISLIALVFIGICLVLYSFSQSPKVVQAANAFQSSQFKQATTSMSFSLTTNARILASTTPGYTRIYATVCNPNANPVYLNLDRDHAANTASSTFVIAAAAGYQACYQINDQNLYQGAVTASSTNETSTKIFVSDYQS